MYKKFMQSHPDQLVVLGIDIAAGDTKEKIIKAYQDKAGITPTFPIVLANDGAKAMAELFGQANFGGPTWIIMPSRDYISTKYTEPDMSADITKALATSVVTPLQKRTEFSMKVMQNNLVIDSRYSGKVKVTVRSIAGRTLYSQSVNLRVGENITPLATQNGLVIVDIQNRQGKRFTQKVVLK